MNATALWIFGGTFALAAVASAQGTLLEGHRMFAHYRQGITPTQTLEFGPVYSVVGPGVEVTGFANQGFMDIDYSDREIVITARTNQPFGITGILLLGDADGAIPDFVTVDFGATNWPTLQPAATQLGPDGIALFFAPSSAAAGQQIFLTLNPITEPSAVVCVPGEAGVRDCPCEPPFVVPEPQSAPGHGCGNSRFPGGAQLAAYGYAFVPPPLDPPLRLAVTNVPDVLTIFLEGDAFGTDQGLFGDGVRCIGGNIRRFGDQVASGGRAIYPRAGESIIAVVVAATHGATRWYQAIYRNPNPSWCGPATFNATNAIEIVWH